MQACRHAGACAPHLPPDGHPAVEEAIATLPLAHKVHACRRGRAKKEPLCTLRHTYLPAHLEVYDDPSARLGLMQADMRIGAWRARGHARCTQVLPWPQNAHMHAPLRACLPVFRFLVGLDDASSSASACSLPVEVMSVLSIMCTLGCCSMAARKYGSGSRNLHAGMPRMRPRTRNARIPFHRKLQHIAQRQGSPHGWMQQTLPSLNIFNNKGAARWGGWGRDDA